jgi:hypothetical protein
MAYSNIDKPSSYFSTNLWVADDTSPRTFSGFGHKPDFVWVKHRGTSSLNHTLVDRVRGGDKMIFSNATTVEDTKSHGEITSWNTDGITVADGTNGTYPRLYFNDFDPFGASVGGNYVCWSWSGSGTTPVSNTAGTISSTVSANTTSGFSIVSYTGNGSSSATVGHGLGVVPKMVICKERNNSDLWQVRHEGLSSNYNLWLHATDRAYNMTNEVNNGGIANLNSSSTFGFVQGVQDVNSVNQSSSTYIAYCFAEVKGFSKFSSFVGNGSTDGAFVYTGFKPAFVMIKASSVGGTGYNWGVWDNKRLGYNADNNDLRINLTNAEATDDSIDLLSNGFKIRTDSGGFGGGSGTTYIYMCFAESPFVSSKSIPTTAR